MILNDTMSRAGTEEAPPPDKCPFEAPHISLISRAKNKVTRMASSLFSGAFEKCFRPVNHFLCMSDIWVDGGSKMPPRRFFFLLWCRMLMKTIILKISNKTCTCSINFKISQILLCKLIIDTSVWRSKTSPLYTDSDNILLQPL